LLLLYTLGGQLFSSLPIPAFIVKKEEGTLWASSFISPFAQPNSSQITHTSTFFDFFSPLLAWEESAIAHL
jgi:hypothetical protein